MNAVIKKRISPHILGPESYDSVEFWLDGYLATAYNRWQGQAYYTLGALWRAMCKKSPHLAGIEGIEGAYDK